jgi:hypothetical protein
MTKNICFHVKSPLIVSDFNETELVRHIFEKYSNLLKIRPVTAELFHADKTGGHTWRG